MTLTRWKVMAGAFGLSLGGLAAVAEPPAPTTAPAIPTVPTVAAPALTPPASVPALPCPTASGVCPEMPTLSAKQPLEILPAPRPVAEQEFTLAVPAAAVAAPGEPTILPVQAAVAPPVSAAPEPAPVAAPVMSAPVAAPAVVAAAPAVAAPAPIASAPAPAALPVVASAPVVQQASVPAQAAPAPAVADSKKLRVMLNMGEDRPRFEVKDGEETLLKLVSDKVDVKCPADRGESLPTMKAVGTVAFFTPGGEGVCDELTLTPGTGQVVVTGKVRFTYHWGKVETEVTGDRMTFRLGAAPGVVGGPGSVNAVPASYRSDR